MQNVYKRSPVQFEHFFKDEFSEFSTTEKNLEKQIVLTSRNTKIRQQKSFSFLRNSCLFFNLKKELSYRTLQKCNLNQSIK